MCNKNRACQVAKFIESSRVSDPVSIPVSRIPNPAQKRVQKVLLKLFIRKNLIITEDWQKIKGKNFLLKIINGKFSWLRGLHPVPVQKNHRSGSGLSWEVGSKSGLSLEFGSESSFSQYQTGSEIQVTTSGKNPVCKPAFVKINPKFLPQECWAIIHSTYINDNIKPICNLMFYFFIIVLFFEMKLRK